MSIVEDREKSIVEAAIRVFLRYGVKRTSMNDIAGEASVARQTLYNVFSNKDDILRAALRLYGAQVVAAIEEGLVGEQTLEGQIRLVLREIAVKPYAFLHSSPHAQDLIEGFNEAGRAELEEGAAGTRACLVRILTPHAAVLADRGLTPEGLAEGVQRAASAFKHEARDEAHLESLLATLTGMALAATAPAVEAAG